MQQKYDELKTENGRMAEKIESLNRVLRDLSASESNLFKATMKIRQLEENLKRSNQSLNEEKRKTRMLMIEKRKQAIANAHAQSEVTRLIMKENRSKEKAKETLKKLNQQRAANRATNYSSKE